MPKAKDHGKLTNNLPPKPRTEKQQLAIERLCMANHLRRIKEMVESIPNSDATPGEAMFQAQILKYLELLGNSFKARKHGADSD